MTKVLSVLFVTKILQWIGPQHIAHRSKRWRLFESVQLKHQTQSFTILYHESQSAYICALKGIYLADMAITGTSHYSILAGTKF